MTSAAYLKAAKVAGFVDKLEQRHARAKRIKRDKALRAKVFARDKGICAKCGRFDARWIHDHKLPLADGGADTLENSQTLCRAPECEPAKTAKEATARAKTKRVATKQSEHVSRLHPDARADRLRARQAAHQKAMAAKAGLA